MATHAAHAQNAVPDSAQGPDTSPADAGEIVVTARLRGETLSRAPVAVTALGAADVKRYSASSLAQISSMAPSVFVIRTPGGTGGAITIRGIGSAPNNPAIDPSVSVAVDGLQINRGRIATGGFFDLAQVEILKGPQALFFGKNSPAGVISLTTAGPTDVWSGYLTTQYEFVGQEAAVEGAVGGPITSNLGVRVALRGRNMRGYLYNNSLPTTNPFPLDAPQLPGAIYPRPGEREFIGRVTLAWQPSDRLDATLKYTMNRYSDDGPVAQGGQVVYCGSVSKPESLGLLDPTGDCKADNQISKGGVPFVETKNWKYANTHDGKPYGFYHGTILSGRINYKAAEGITLSSITGYYDGVGQYFDTYSADTNAQISSSERDHYQTFSQELRVVSDWQSPLNFTAGAYFQRTDLDFENIAKFSSRGPDPATGFWYTVDRVAKVKGRTISLFGQLRYQLSDSLEISGGARWSDEKKDSILMLPFAQPALVAAGSYNLTPFYPNFRDKNVSPEATISYHPTSNSTIYLSYKTGYKSGGANIGTTPNARTTTESLIFRPEKVHGFEGGVKGSLFDRKLRLDLSAWAYNYQDLQVSQFNTVVNAFTVSNAASVHQRGAEVSANYAASPEVALRGAVTYNHSRYVDYLAQCYAQQTAAQGCVAGSQNLSGRPTARAPDWTGNIGGTFTKPLTDRATLILTGDARYTGAYYFSETQSPGAIQAAQWKFDASARLTIDKWELALIGKNLSNRYSVVYGTDKPGTTTGQQYGAVTRGREVTVQATYTF